MELVCQILVVLEIIFINLFCAHACSEKKYSTGIVVAVQLAFTAVLVTISFLFLKNLPFFGNGNGLFVFIGFAYLLPIRFLYKQTMNRSMLIICSIWVYSFVAFSVSVQFGYIFEAVFPLETTALVCQSLIFIFTSRFFLRFVKEKFFFILTQVGSQTQVLISKVNFLSFFLMVALHLAFIFPSLHSLRIISLLLLFFNIILSYNLLRRIIKDMKTVEKLEMIAHRDNLTGLKNRVSFYEEVQGIIDRNQAFTLIFIDLDRFKEINDQYGHQEGDRYLCSFSERLKKTFSGEDMLYRFAGDEFVCLYIGTDIEAIKRIGVSISSEEQKGFLGASIGSARFPEDAQNLDQLLSMADYAMYREKQQKKRSNR